MKPNYKIIREPKELSDEQIDRHKNFQQLLGNYQQVHKYGTLTKPFLHNFKIFSIVMVAGVIILLLILDNRENNQKESKTPEAIPNKQKSADTSASPEKSDTSAHLQTPEVRVDKSGNVSVQTSTTETTWKYMVEFDAARDFVHQFDNGIRVLIDANTLLDKAGNPAKGKMELVYRDASDFASNLPVKKNSVEFEMRVREKTTKAWADLSASACIEVPLKLSNTARVYHWSAPKERWQPAASELKFRFDLHTDQSAFKVLENHVWEMSYPDYSTYAAFNYVFGKDWRQFEWNKSKSLSLKGSGSTAFNAVPARLYADPERQKQFEEKVFQCFSLKKPDTCSGKTRTHWHANNLMLRSDITTVSFNTQRTGLFLIEYETINHNSAKYRTLNLVAYPTSTKSTVPDNYNP